MAQDIKTVAGKVADVFAHRFVIATEDGKVLADLGSKGAERLSLAVGDEVEVTGEVKPSELKVSRIVRQGGETVDISHEPKKHTDDRRDDYADPAVARRAVEANGFTIVGEPRRKPNHFEIIGRGTASDMLELHVDFDGTIRKTKPHRHGGT